MARQIDSSRWIAHPAGKGSGRDRLKEIELHIDGQGRTEQAGDIVARRVAAVSQPLGELGKRMERMQWAVARSGALADFNKRLEAIADRQRRIAQAGDIVARRVAAASQSLGELAGRVECLPPGLSVPPVPRQPEVPTLDLAWQLGSLPPTRPLRPVAAQSEAIKPYGNSQRNVSLELTLAAFEPAFADQFRGARLRSEERGPDWFTQAAASIRKLLLSLLHAAAPDECVLTWVQDRKAQLDRNGRPTRRTKIEWLCRSIKDTGFRRFVRSELNSALEVLELCNQAVHVNEFPDFEESFTSVFARVEFAVLHIVRLSGRRRST